MQRNITERFEDAISSLKQEILELKQQYKENRKEIAFLSRANIKKALESFNEKSSNDESTNMKNIQAELMHCEQELEVIKALTGIVLTRCLKKKETRTEKVIFSHKLMGQCRFLSFAVAFETLSLQPERCEVIHVNIQMDCEENSDLIKLVSRTHESLNLLGFFRTLSTFTEWCEYRQSTFSQFKDKYPLAVGLPLGSSADYMVLMNPDLPGCEWILVWKITINEEGAVTPVLDLLPKIPVQAAAFDRTGILKSAAVRFKTLLRALGLQATIENIIQSFCMKRGSN
ncbi:centromere protein P [Rhinoderma darwinii]|uniref:centromere protein P n=1 Tax=Rhinoderma darwinii TaxID=43563 RepID=UPI003F6805EB